MFFMLIMEENFKSGLNKCQVLFKINSTHRDYIIVSELSSWFLWLPDQRPRSKIQIILKSLKEPRPFFFSCLMSFMTLSIIFFEKMLVNFETLPSFFGFFSSLGAV